MGFWGKLILGGLGWTLGGPIGAIIGVLIGRVFDKEDTEHITDGGNRNNSGGEYKGYNSSGYNSGSNNRKTSQSDFLMVLMVLSAAVMKADGKVLKSELDEVKAFLRKNFTEEEGKEALQMLKKLLQTNFNYREVCMQVRVRLNYSGKLELLHLLFKISYADGDIAQSELNIIYEMSSLMAISRADFDSVRYAYVNYKRSSSGGYSGGSSSSDSSSSMTLAEAYKILQIESTVTDEEVKKAYRRMAMKYHPDKVNNLGEEVKKSATEKFKTIGEAYNKIKIARNMK